MFQVMFLNCVARPQGKTPSDILRNYNRTLGTVDRRLLTFLQRRSKMILACKSYRQYFAAVAHPLKDDCTPTNVYKKLEKAQRDSVNRGYERFMHRNRKR